MLLRTGNRKLEKLIKCLCVQYMCASPFMCTCVLVCVHMPKESACSTAGKVIIINVRRALCTACSPFALFFFAIVTQSVYALSVIRLASRFHLKNDKIS